MYLLSIEKNKDLSGVVWETLIQMTPEPSISPSSVYQTANWPGVMPRWGASKRM